MKELPSYEEKKIKILVEARALFARYGFHKCTLQDIASACGLTKPALYYYFSSKDDLFTAVVRQESLLFLNLLKETIQPDESPLLHLRAFFVVRFERFKELLVLYDLTQQVGRELLPLAEQARQDFFIQEMSILMEILDKGVEDGIFKPLSSKLIGHSLIAVFKGLESNFFTADQSPEEAIQSIHELLKLFFYGIVKE